MDDLTKEFIIQVYKEAIATFDIEYLSKSLKKAGINSTDPEVAALLRALDESYGIY
jgi:hypothetical protein